MEINLERTDRDTEIVLDQQSVARVLTSIKLDISTQVEGYQVRYSGGRAVISVWAKAGLNLEKFCRSESINVNKGVITTDIWPAGRRDVTVSVAGLDFNTPDSLFFL